MRLTLPQLIEVGEASTNAHGVEFTMIEWTPFRKVSDRPSADALAELLLTRGIPARVEAPCLLPGVDGYFAIVVPTELLHRARWAAPELPFDERELTYLATGELDIDLE